VGDDIRGFGLAFSDIRIYYVGARNPCIRELIWFKEIVVVYVLQLLHTSYTI
jgi:hypothetical protein